MDRRQIKLGHRRACSGSRQCRISLRCGLQGSLTATASPSHHLCGQFGAASIPEWFLLLMAILSAIGLGLGVLRHYWDIYTHRSVRGISFWFVGLDAAGDLASIISIGESCLLCLKLP
jgi:hypothetical protein